MFMEFAAENLWLFVALGIILLMLLYSYFGDKLSGFQTISPDEATRLYNDGAKLIDVRSETEYKTGFIGEAENLPISSFESKISKLEPHKEKPIIVYCQSGARSAKAAGILAKHGFTQVYNLRGGILSWTAAGLPTNKKKSKKAAKNTKN